MWETGGRVPVFQGLVGAVGGCVLAGASKPSTASAARQRPQAPRQVRAREPFVERSDGGHALDSFFGEALVLRIEGPLSSRR
jgi:hypothetical protein